MGSGSSPLPHSSHPHPYTPSQHPPTSKPPDTSSSNPPRTQRATPTTVTVAGDNSQANLQGLPAEMMLNIASRLDTRPLLAVRQVSRQFEHNTRDECAKRASRPLHVNLSVQHIEQTLRLLPRITAQTKVRWIALHGVDSLRFATDRERTSGAFTLIPGAISSRLVDTQEHDAARLHRRLTQLFAHLTDLTMVQFEDDSKFRSLRQMYGTTAETQICSIGAPVDQVIRLFTQHKATLKSVYINGLTFHDGDWRQILEFFQAELSLDNLFLNSPANYRRGDRHHSGVTFDNGVQNGPHRKASGAVRNPSTGKIEHYSVGKSTARAMGAEPVKKALAYMRFNMSS